ARLPRELVDHRLRPVEAVDSDAPLGERQGDAAGADAELERRACAREPGQEVDGRLDDRRVELLAGRSVIELRPLLAEEALAVFHAARHGLDSTAPSDRRPTCRPVAPPPVLPRRPAAAPPSRPAHPNPAAPAAEQDPPRAPGRTAAPPSTDAAPRAGARRRRSRSRPTTGRPRLAARPRAGRGRTRAGPGRARAGPSAVDASGRTLARAPSA